jgi:hypothetical protein
MQQIVGCAKETSRAQVHRTVALDIRQNITRAISEVDILVAGGAKLCESQISVNRHTIETDLQSISHIAGSRRITIDKIVGQVLTSETCAVGGVFL